MTSARNRQSILNDAIQTAGHVQVDCILPIHTAGRVYRQNAINLHMASQQMATLDVAKLLLLSNQTKLTLNITLTLTDTVMQKSQTKLTLTVTVTLTDTVTVIFLRAFR